MKFLVTGATGNVGRLVVDHLLQLGATDVRALTNKPGEANLPADKVEVVEGFLGKLETMPRALEGVERLYLAPLPRTTKQVMELAKQAGVRYVVDLSSSGAEDEAAGDPSGWHYYAVEQAVEASGLAWTHLRPGEFMTNTFMWADQIRSTGVVRAAYGEAATAVIDLDDIAAVAAQILLDGPDLHAGQTYLLSGPEAVKRKDLVRLIGDAIQRDIPFQELTYAEALKELEPTMGEYAAWYLDGMNSLVEYPQPASPWFERITGKRGTSFADWAAKNRSAFS